MNETKKCKYCQSDIDKKAKICPVCKKGQKNPVIGGILIAIVIFIFCFFIAFIINLGENIQTNSGISNDTNITTVVTKENYEKIQKGMTKQQVFEILGDNATISEYDSGYGIMELYHYQELKSITQSIDIYFYNGIVDSKNWVQL